MADDTELIAALSVIQQRGAIGEKSLVDAIRHADRFVALIPPGRRSVIDLGSGGGLPALVICCRRPDLTVMMVERRATRADLLRRAVASLRLGERSMVVTADVGTVCTDTDRRFDVVTARSFADVATTVRFIDLLLAPGGIGLVSEPPADRSDVWTSCLEHHPSLRDEGAHQGVRRLRRES
ncbi:MAG TPA: RsmG family class I SAM-dependent methyltransferase [Ilumatobacteraceae bacterium]|nr:RsmG family class I SAM-dependent methyltransferase [Ilumatobacteraceae bacterium]